MAALPVSVVGPEQLLIPAKPSEQLKPTVTSLLFQPFALAAGDRSPVIVGAVLSSLIVIEPDPELPRRSVAVDVLVTPAVLDVCESVAGVGPVATPDPASVADHVTETFESFQPAPLGVGESAPVTTGPVLSRMKDADWGLCDWPVQLLALKLGDAVAVTVLTPSPVLAVKLKVQLDFAEVEVWCPLNAPMTSTHFVSLEVVTVSVNAPPCLA